MKLKTGEKMHNKKQRLTFFLVINKYIKEDLFLPKIIKNLKESLDQPTRQIIKDRANTIEIDQDINTIKILALFYCLHIQRPKDGYMSMFTKYLIKDTEIDFKPRAIKKMNELIKDLLEEIGLPSFEDTTKAFVHNIYYYEPDFIDKYPELEKKIKPGSEY